MTLTVIGSKPTPEVLALDSPENGIKVVGYAKDVAPYFEKARVFVSPLRYGAGIKGKNIQAMSFGLPMVTTAIGAEGLNFIDYKNALIANKPEEFTQKVIKLYADRELWESISRNSLKYVENNNSPKAAWNKFKNLFQNLMGK